MWFSIQVSQCNSTEKQLVVENYNFEDGEVADIRRAKRQTTDSGEAERKRRSGTIRRTNKIMTSYTERGYHSRIELFENM